MRILPHHCTPPAIVLYGGVAIISAFLIAPLLIVIPMSFSDSTLMQFPPPRLSLRWYRAYFGDHAWIDATWISLKAGVLVAILSTSLGVAAAIGLARGRIVAGAALRSLILSPLVVPVIILAVGLYYLYAFLHVNNTLTGLVLGHVVLTLPYAVVVVSASLEELDRTLEQAALGLGATPWKAFRRVTLPLIAPAVAVAFLFAFLTSFDEVVLAVFVTGPETTTLPRKMWEGIRFELNPTIAAVSTLLIVVSWSVMLLVGLLRWTHQFASGESRHESGR
jgi:putative spermidine/putrescine transport system permease protein